MEPREMYLGFFVMALMNNSSLRNGILMDAYQVSTIALGYLGCC